MDWAKARRGSTKALTVHGPISDTQRNMHRALYNLHLSELWVLPKYRFDSTVVTREQQKAPDLFGVWERQHGN